MNSKPLKGWLKHADFIIIDILCLQLCFIFAYWINQGGIYSPYRATSYILLDEVLLLGQLLTIVFSSNYKSIIRRGRLDELISVLNYELSVLLIALVALFAFQLTGIISRMQVGVTMVLYLGIDYLLRQWNKRRIYARSANSENKLGKSLVLITAGNLVDDAMQKLTAEGMFRRYFVSAIVLTDGDHEAVTIDHEVPIYKQDDAIISHICKGWFDEVFVLQPNDNAIDRALMDDLIEMGLTVHYCPEILNDDNWIAVNMQKLGQFRVLTSSIKFVPPEMLIFKRMMDIIGGIVGCLITGILYLFVAPAIYRKSPGPIFFTQERIGQNGKTFRMYKFRSMYLDAEERKAALMAQNKIADGLMFKLDDDPRIIGSEKKGKDGRPRGIGNFIRNTSIDEFPQFWNVLKGDMSLVGTRPPLVGEWELYDLHHRARMTVKPGVTGLWQISGRSQITDFEEVVRLDREYIENWSFRGDIRIILKTVVAVVKRKGAE